MATTGKQLSSLPDASGFGGSNELLTWVGEGLAQKVTRDDFVASLPENRQSATAYTAGNIVGNAGLPNGYYLECTTGGNTAATALTISGSVIADVTTFSDGTVTWTVRKNMNSADLGYRQPSTAYTAGQIAYHSALPTGYYLECTTGGTSSSGALTISTTTIGTTVADGTVVWTIRDMSTALIKKSTEETDLDNANINGYMYYSGLASNAPTTASGMLLSMLDQINVQIATDTDVNQFFRKKQNGTWSAWQQQEAIVAKSLGQNGYVKYTSGFIMQWGRVYVNINETKTITYPIKFPNGCMSMSLALKSASVIESVSITCQAEQSTAFISNKSSVNADIYYIAIGY
jgi:hypothetical protein